jgi:ketosteroid isomerase-like protein
MKNLTILTILIAFALNACTQDSFTEKTFHDFIAENEDQMFLSENTDKNFVFIAGSGWKLGITDFIEQSSKMTIKNEFSDLTVNQSGGTAIVSGIIDQKITQKENPSDVFEYKGVFTAVFASQNNKWVLMSWQHSDYRPEGSFTEKTFHELMAKTQDRMFTVENTDKNFVFIMGNGGKMNRSEFIDALSTIAVENDFSELKVNQSGGTAIVSGMIDQKITPKENPAGAWNYKGVFTAVYAAQNNNWVLMSWQHSDYKPNN